MKNQKALRLLKKYCEQVKIELSNNSWKQSSKSVLWILNSKTYPSSSLSISIFASKLIQFLLVHNIFLIILKLFDYS